MIISVRMSLFLGWQASTLSRSRTAQVRYMCGAIASSCRYGHTGRDAARQCRCGQQQVALQQPAAEPHVHVAPVTVCVSHTLSTIYGPCYQSEEPPSRPPPPAVRALTSDEVQVIQGALSLFSSEPRHPHTHSLTSDASSPPCSRRADQRRGASHPGCTGSGQQDCRGGDDAAWQGKRHGVCVGSTLAEGGCLLGRAEGALHA
jgi:hypothetical protein